MNSKIKSFKDLMEGMTTSNAFTITLPSRGSADLQNFQTGLTGEGDIDYGEGGLGDEVMAGEGQYTCFSNLDDLQNVNDPNSVGTFLRVFDQNTQQFRSGSTGGGAHGYVPAIPGYIEGMMRNVKPTGDYSANDKSRRENKGLPLTQNGSNLYYHLYGQTNDELGKGFGSWNSNDGVTDDGFGTALHFDGSGSPRYVALKSIDSTEVDTIKIHAAVGDDDIVNTVTSGGLLRDKRLQVYYWSGDHKDYVKHPSASLISGETRDGWRPINMKPNGELDDTVDPYIIKHTAERDSNGTDANGVQYDTDHRLHAYSLPIPEYTRGKNARYMLVQVDKTNTPQDAFALTSIRFQRKNNISLTVSLDSPEGSNFVRGGIIDGKTTTPEERKKRVGDILKSSSLYVTGQFGKGFPGQPTVTAGDSTFDTKRFTEETSIEEQTTFPQMQERIRNAKEKRREQQKKSEKLYMDTKKKGVKFYDKKGTGRLKDGKKIYD